MCLEEHAKKGTEVFLSPAWSYHKQRRRVGNTDLGPHPRPTDENRHFHKTPGASKLHLKCEKHWPVEPPPGLPQVVLIVRICT